MGSYDEKRREEKKYELFLMMGISGVGVS